MHTGLTQIHKLSTNHITNRFIAKVFMSAKILLFHNLQGCSQQDTATTVPKSLSLSSHTQGDSQNADNQNGTSDDKSEETLGPKSKQTHPTHNPQGHRRGSQHSGLAHVPRAAPNSNS